MTKKIRVGVAGYGTIGQRLADGVALQGDMELVGVADLAPTLAIRALKPQVHWGLYDPKREEEIFTNLGTCNTGPLYAENLREIYEAILHVMKEMRG